MASALSSMYGAASTAAKVFGEAVTVIDSGQLSMGLGFQVLAAAHAAAKDTVVSTLQPILEAVHNIQDRIKVIAMLDTMEQLRRSGRVSWVQAGIGTLLQLKLIVELKEGKVLRLGETRTRKKGILRIKQILQNIGEIDQLSILHSNAPDDAQILAEKFPLEGNKLPSIRNVTTVIGTHVGVRALGFAAVIKN
jgi:DegV family protein with EDD domain